MIKKIINAISIINRKVKYKKCFYSFNAVDIVVDYIFKNNKSGFYLDVGAQHPISNNNTYLLYKRGWKGINIDLDKKNIELFNIARPGDINLNYAVSNKNTTENLYFYHDKSPINTLNYKVHNFQDAKVKSIKKIQTQSLDNILKEIKFDKKIDYMNIDVEGHEEKVLEGFDIKKYKPSVISVEYLDLNMKKLELKNNNLQNITNSNLYNFFTINNYHFVNWLHGDLIFVHKDFRD